MLGEAVLHGCMVVLRVLYVLLGLCALYWQHRSIDTDGLQQGARKRRPSDDDVHARGACAAYGWVAADSGVMDGKRDRKDMRHRIQGMLWRWTPLPEAPHASSGALAAAAP